MVGFVYVRSEADFGLHLKSKYEGVILEANPTVWIRCVHYLIYKLSGYYSGLEPGEL